MKKQPAAMTTEQNDVTERLNQVYAAESSALDPMLRKAQLALLADEEQFGSVTLMDYAELYDFPLGADAYRREFPEDEAFTHPPTDEE